MLIDLNQPNHSYFYGLTLCDAHLSASTRNRGKLAMEISERDRDILVAFQSLFAIHSSIKNRTRITNFSAGKSVTTCILAFFDYDFRQELIAIGFPVGKKDTIEAPPSIPFCEIDFMRGLIDGNGSLGLDSRDIPFLSLTTKSDALCVFYLDFMKRHFDVVKTCNRNKRDSIYNIVLLNERAQELAALLYYPACLCIERKRSKAKEVLNWKRPDWMPKRDWIAKPKEMGGKSVVSQQISA